MLGKIKPGGIYLTGLQLGSKQTNVSSEEI